jgi:ketosteroid isomerase-like protein
VKQELQHRRAIENYPEKWREMPFFDLTFAMFDCVSTHDFDRLASICDDDYGIIDINPEGGSEVIRDRKGWEHWFRSLFERLDQMHATTWSEITNYEALVKGEMGYSVVDFDQILMVGEKRHRFSVLATIIWKKTGNGWKESRYHSSMLGVSEE